MKDSNFMTGKGIVLLFMLITLSLPVFSITTSYDDNYFGTTFAELQQWGTSTDRVVFENGGDFELQLTPTANEEMVCIEWNNLENEGGNDNVFEPNYCFISDDIFLADEERGCLDLVLDEIDPDNLERNKDFGDLNFPMDDFDPYQIETWVRSYHCIDRAAENVTLEDDDTLTWYIIDRRWHDCDDSRGLSFDLEGYFINGNNIRAWINMYSPTCILQYSDKNGYPYDSRAGGFGFSSGEVRCDESQDDQQILTEFNFITADDTTNEHPCTINEGLDVTGTGAYSCSTIDVDECQTGICNLDNICGSCAINDFEVGSSPTDDDSDNNNILKIGTNFGQLPSWTQDNSDDGVDCVGYDYDDDGTFDYCAGDNSVAECAALGPTCSGNANDVINLISLTSTGQIVNARAIDDSCGQEEDYFYTVQFRDVRIKNSSTDVSSYTLSNSENQISTNTDDIQINFQTEGDTFLGYFCRFTTTGEPSTTSTTTGVFNDLTTYSCDLDISSHGQDTGDNIDLQITAYIDDDVRSTTFFDSEWIYDDFVRSTDYYLSGSKAKTNRWITNNFYAPASCEYLADCTIYDNYTISSLPTLYNYDNSWYDVIPPRYIRTTFYDDDTNFAHCTNTLSVFGIDSYIADSIYQWSVDSTCNYPYSLSGAYSGRIEQCYQFWFSSNWYCENKYLTVELPINTFITIMQVFNSTSQISENYGQNKYESLDFCADDSFVGSNNTNVIFHLDYDGDGVEDGNNTWTSCITVNYGANDSDPFITARGWLTSNERFGGYYDFDYRVNGLCGDYIDDWDEYGVDDPNATSRWSEKCWGTCYDNTKNANEAQIDYKGRCGNCTGNSLSGDDLSWLLLKESKYLYFPFEPSQCIEVQGAAGSFLFISFFVLFLIILIGLFAFLGSISIILNLAGVKFKFLNYFNPFYWIWFVFKWLIFGSKKQKNKKEI